MIRTAAKTQAKIYYKCLTDINSRYHGLSLMRILTQGPYSVRYNSLFTDPLFSLQSPSSAGDSLRSRARLALAHADVFQKNEKKKKTASVYRLPL